MSLQADDANISVWNQFCETDPAFTKGFNRGGGFKGTATNVVYQIRRATEVWGPIGGRWGVRIIDEQILEGAPILHKDSGAIIGCEKIHKVRIEFFYPAPDGSVGVIPQFGQTTFVGVNKYGPFTDEEAPKKSLTDAMSKAMSWLGFSADIHMGLWDDNKYVSPYAGEEPPQQRTQRRASDNPPPTEAEKTLALVSHEQAAQLVKLSHEAGLTDDECAAFLKAIGDRAGVPVATFNEVPVIAYSKAVTTLTNRAKPRGAA